MCLRSFGAILGHLGIEVLVDPGCIQNSHVICHLHDLVPKLLSFKAAKLMPLIPWHVVGILHDVIGKAFVQEASCSPFSELNEENFMI